MFSCDKCGECCRNLFRSKLYVSLNRGDGVCKYLNGNLCSIYQDRPLLCRVDESYKMFFSEKFSLEEYYQLNKTICEKLKADRKVGCYGNMGNRGNG